MTVNGLASLDYGIYSLNNNSNVNQYAVDSSTVSKQYFDISDIGTADNALAAEKSVSFNSVGNINTYAGNLFQESQLNSLSEINSSLENNHVDELLSGTTDSNSLLDNINVDTAAVQAYEEGVIAAENLNSNPISNYENSLQNSSSSGLNMLV